ncbi:MAG: hypothetical protein ACLGI3_06380, partial [Actinomycetes bacterium]
APLEGWEGPAEPLALAISLSTIEHFGVAHYDLEEGDLDRGIGTPSTGSGPGWRPAGRWR